MADDARLPRKIFLTGLMGSGKSYWGRQLAAHFRRPFLDLDKGIEMAERKPIAEIFSSHGEDYFRQVEHHTLLSLIAYPKFVMSCGGGTPCYFDNMSVMKKNGIVIWLNPPLETLAERLMPGRLKRPLIKNAQTEEDLVVILSKLTEERKSFYEMSDYTLSTSNPGIETFENLLIHA
jgi:shikimate kinase